MRKLIGAINMTIDGFCDHTAIDPDKDIHQHYQELLEDGDAILYGRKTYELMQFWQDMVKNPSGDKSMDDFAGAIDKIPKIVFSNTWKKAGRNAGWESAQLAHKELEEVAMELKQQSGKPIYAGSRSIILQLLKLDLMDELQLCIHPVVVGRGLPLFADENDRMIFKLLATKEFNSGAIILYYGRM